ncbi:MAG: phosphoribosylanthranilate isomerase [Bacteroidia bacterium]|nr:phosphoribosylanthranilate isomerase [Bacteroidia bacterium]
MINGNLQLKVCGMREPSNISEVAALNPDFMGFIFYFKSSRFVEMMVFYVAQRLKAQGIEPVAVFVNPSVAYVLHIRDKYGFTHIQLHGRETPQTCAELKNMGLHVLKAISVAEAADLEATKEYEGTCDYFLFDTKSNLPGGSGKQFNWEILENYKGETPFFLSGGIGPDDVERIKGFSHPKLVGIDVNSKFETRPAHKDAELLKSFIQAF